MNRLFLQRPSGQTNREPGRALSPKAPALWSRARSTIIRLLCWVSLAVLVSCSKESPESLKVKAVSSSAISLFVSTNGNDQWSGTLASPNWLKTDGPFASLTRALDAAQKVGQEPTNRNPARVSIFVRQGTYFLKSPLKLTPAESNLTLAAYPREKPIISAGRLITGWKSVPSKSNTLWSAALPETSRLNWIFRELWVNGTRAVRARYPNQGYLHVVNAPDKTASWTVGQERFRIRQQDVPPLTIPTDGELVLMDRWMLSRLPITGLDRNQLMLGFARPAALQIANEAIYYLEGAPEFLDSPGEWYLDRATAKVLYCPRPGEKLENLEVIAPAFAHILSLEGEPGQGKWVENVHIRGLDFRHSEWYFPVGYRDPTNEPSLWFAPNQAGGLSQSAFGLPGALRGKGVRNCAFEGCSFSQMGNYGIELTRGCQSNQISGCIFNDLGGGGIKIGEPTIRNHAADLTGLNEILNCEIRDGGKLFHSASGIWLGQTFGNHVAHNLIQDFYYSGLAMGWTWGYHSSLATNNLVEFNHIHHLGRKTNGDGPIFSDLGAIYTLGPQPGSILANNLMHDISGLVYGGWGLYFDEGTSGVLAVSNLVYRTTHGGFHQHYGETNALYNNIFAYGRELQLGRTRLEPRFSFCFATNIVYYNSGVLLVGAWLDGTFVMDWNLFFDARPEFRPESMSIGPGLGTLLHWFSVGHDTNSLFADPFFVGPEKGDFRLLSNSPAFKIGFHPLDFGRAGPLRSAKGGSFP